MIKYLSARQLQVLGRVICPHTIHKDLCRFDLELASAVSAHFLSVMLQNSAVRVVLSTVILQRRPAAVCSLVTLGLSARESNLLVF